MASGSRIMAPGTLRAQARGALLALAAAATGLWARQVPQAVAGPFWYDGDVVSGGQLVYRVRIDAEVPGAVHAEAKIKGKDKASGVKWKGVFPVLHQEVPAGVTDLTSAAIPIPAEFVGEARLQVDVEFNGKAAGRGKLTVVVTEPPPPEPEPELTDTLRDVGFDTLVTLDVEAATKGAVSKAETHTYHWTQTGGEEVELSDPSAAAPTFRTHPISHFVELDDEPGLIGLSSLHVAESTYTFTVHVHGGATKGATGAMTVISGSVSPAQPTVPLGVNAYLKAGAEETKAFNWALVAVPAGSAAVLMNPATRTPHIRPDLPGRYTLREGVSGEQFTITGATFVGVATCALCHGPEPVADIFPLADMVTPWSLTGHATMLDRGLDGILSSHYNASCVACHSVGYNLTPTADNGGFDDVAADVGWRFPQPLQSGNAAALPEALHAKANIQCENCHGPGSSHPGAASESLDVAVCATCHDDGHYHNRPSQWRASPHAEPYKELSAEEGTNPSCARCHSPAGYVDTHKGVTAIRAEVGMLTCQTCHDPHNMADHENQLRVVDAVTLPGNLVLGDLGTSATCVYCHNARREPISWLAGAANSRGPHGATKAEVFFGVNGYDFGEPIGGMFVHALTASCTHCHMAPNPPAGDPLHNRVGDHTFSVTAVDAETKEEVENVAVCNGCHGAGEVTTFNYRGDAYDEDNDGDGVNEGLQSEVQGLLNAVETLLVSQGVNLSTRTGWDADAEKRKAQRGAFWNWGLVSNDKSLGVHNPQYAIALLQKSWSKASQALGGPSFAETFPQADLR